jgi:uncharacterized RDD family membrane protein YckC
MLPMSLPVDQIAAPALGYAPDRAIRARLNAILIDGILIGVLSRLLLPALGAHSLASASVGFLVLQFLYFFIQEADGGQTIGKRRSRLRVVQLDGTRPTLQQVAIRNALRAFDTLPMFYASGLISVMWTGPGRRQRLGDRTAGTTVILEPGGKPLATPTWLLQSLTVLAVLLSVVVYGLILNEYRTPNVGANALTPLVVPGYAGDNSQQPGPGRFAAQATVNGAPVVDLVSHKQMLRSWLIEKHCAAGTSCTYAITRSVPGFGEESGQLQQAADGWHVDFPTHAFRARCPGRSGLVTVMRRASFVVHFEPGGQAAEAHERTLFRSDSCGAFTTRLDWNASLAGF